MKLKIIQNSVGRYNLMGNEHTLQFSMAIVDDEGKVITDGVNKAILSYSGEPDEQDEFEEAIEDVGRTFGKCLGYSKRVIGSTDYEGNCIFFAKTYSQNFETLNEAHILSEKLRLEKELERVQRALQGDLSIYDARDDIENELKKEIKKYEGWILSSENELKQLLPESEKAAKENERIEKYRAKIKDLALHDKE
jgi:hypothetical protein